MDYNKKRELRNSSHGNEILQSNFKQKQELGKEYQHNMAWICYADERKEETFPTKMLNTKMEEKRPKRKHTTIWIDQIRKDIEMRGGNGR